MYREDLIHQVPLNFGLATKLKARLGASVRLGGEGTSL